MGFQQELFEVDLERGDGYDNDRGNGGGNVCGKVSQSNSGHMRAENAISYALVLLIAANLVQPTGNLGKTLGILAGMLSIAGSVMLVRRQPSAAHAKKILVILATVWVLYGVRLVHLGENGRIKAEAAAVMAGNGSGNSNGTPNGYNGLLPGSLINGNGIGNGRGSGNGNRNSNINGNGNGNGEGSGRNHINAAMEAPPMPQPAARILPARSFNLDDVNVGEEPGNVVDEVDGKL